MTGIEMVDRDPVELGVEIALHLSHEITDEGLEVGQLCSLVSRYHEAELVRVLLRSFQQGACIHVLTRRVV